MKNHRMADTVRESSNLNNVGAEFCYCPKQKHINKPTSNVVGDGLDQPNIKIKKTGRSRPTPTRHKIKHCNHINCVDNHNNRIINPCRCNTKYGNRR